MQFDPATFMQTVYTEVNDTKVVPCPAGEWQAQIVELKPKTGTISKGERAGETWAGVDIVWEISDDRVTSITNRKPTKVRQNLFLDLNATGAIDFSQGKNIGLGRLREACDLNRPGQPFNFSQLIGKLAIVNVSHRIDDSDPSKMYDEVKTVRKQ